MPDTSGSVQPPFASPAGEEADAPQRGPGKVYLVGAGPGDPGLLTLRGRECLELADVVLFDGLANERLLEFASRAECISVGKHGRIPLWTQEEINQKMLELAGRGLQVVRLKGGDPAIFARTAEELEALQREHVDFEVVPGITAALAAASYLGIPITHRHHASAVALVTGQQQGDSQRGERDWQALAHFPGTLVFYMGVTTAGQWTAKLIQAGKPPNTPAAIVRRCTWSDQSVLRCELSRVAEHLTPASKLRPPVIVIVGAVANLGQDFNWFSARPLHGCGILVTRAAHQSQGLSEQLRLLGGEVYQQPAFTIEPPADLRSLDSGLDVLAEGKVQGLSFSSSNAVDGLLQRALDRGWDARLLAGVRLAAVGPATAQRLGNYGLRCDVIAGANGCSAAPIAAEHSAAGLLATLGESVRGESWIVTTTNRSRDTLASGLRQAGAQVRECLAYQTQPVTELNPDVAAALQAGRIHLATISSGLVAEATAQLLGDYRHSVQPVCLGEAVAEKLAQLGWPAVAVSRSHSWLGLVDAIAEGWSQQT